MIFFVVVVDVVVTVVTVVEVAVVVVETVVVVVALVTVLVVEVDVVDVNVVVVVVDDKSARMLATVASNALTYGQERTPRVPTPPKKKREKKNVL